MLLAIGISLIPKSAAALSPDEISAFNSDLDAGDQGAKEHFIACQASQESAQSGVVRHALVFLDGCIQGSIQQLLGEDLELKHTSAVTGEFHVPGAPKIVLKQEASIGKRIQGTGSATPDNYKIMLIDHARIGALYTRTDPVSMPVVAAPPPYQGTQDVTVKNPAQIPKDFSKIRSLTVIGENLAVSVPPGNYRHFVAKDGATLILGAAGGPPAQYQMDDVTLASGSRLQVAGPVVLTVRAGFYERQGSVAGNPDRPQDLTVQIASGDQSDAILLGVSCEFYGQAIAPTAAVLLRLGSLLRGTVMADKLMVGRHAVIQGTGSIPPPVNQPPVVNAGASQTITLPSAAFLIGTATDDGLPVGSTLTVRWSTLSGPGPVTFANPSVPVTTATFVSSGTYVLQLSASDSQYTSTSTVTITVLPAALINQPPVVSAGANQTITLPSAAFLNGSATDDGLPVGSTLSISWNLVSGPGPVTFANSSIAATTATFTSSGTYVLQLSASDGQYTSTSSVTITVLPAALVNQPPVVNAGANQTITLPSAAFLIGTATDDGLPAGSTLTVTWSTLSGPGLVTFANPSVAITTATFVSSGTYVLQLSASDSQYTSTSTVTITVLPAALINQPPVVSAGANQTITLPSAAFLIGTATDDGLPAGSSLNVAWNMVSGPGPVTFANSFVAATTATFTSSGTYVLQLSASDGQYTSTSAVTITVLPVVPNAPVVNAGVPQTITLPNPAILSGSVTEDGLPAGSAVSTLWSVSSGSGPVTFADARSAATTATFTSSGTYVLCLTATDTQTQLTGFAEVSITVLPQNGPPPPNPPVANAGPDRTVTLPANLVLIGTATEAGLPAGRSLTVLWSEVSGPFAMTFTNPSVAVTTAVFTVPGIYDLRLTASDGVQISTSDMHATVRPAPPVANAGGPYSGQVGAPVILDGSRTLNPSNSPLSYAWTFGDGASGAGVTISHVYQSSGVFTAVLTVNDGQGNVSASSAAVTITNPAVPTPPLVTLTAPLQAIPSARVTLSAQITAANPIQSVIFTLGTFDPVILTSAPYQASFTLPSSAVPGSQLSARVVVVDNQGLSGSAAAVLTIANAPDTTPPSVTLNSPMTSLAGRTIYLSAVAADDVGVSTVTFSANGATIVSLTRPPYETSYAVSSAQSPGSTVSLLVEAFDAAGNRGTDSRILVVVSTQTNVPPSVALNVPASVVAGQFLPIAASASDSAGIVSVTLAVQGETIATLTGPPYSATYPVSPAAPAGSILQVTAQALNFAGLTNSATAQVRVLPASAGAGIIAGSIFDDSTGLPLQDSSATWAGVTTDGALYSTMTYSGGRGNYALNVLTGTGTVHIRMSGYTAVDRSLQAAGGQAMRAFDARLTPLSAQQSVSALLGGSLAASSATLTIPAGSLAADAVLGLATPGPQGLQGLLPAGWTPLAAADIEPHGLRFAAPATLTLTPSQLYAPLNGSPITTAVWDETAQLWRAIATAAAGGGVYQVTLSSSAEVAWIQPDILPQAPPAASNGQPIAGVLAAALPDNAVTVINPNPQVLFYQAGVHSQVSGGVSTSTPVPSGLPLQMTLTETYQFADGTSRRPEPFAQDLVFYQSSGGAPNLSAGYVVSPSEQFDATQLSSGVLTTELDVPAGDGLAVIGQQGGSLYDQTGGTLTIPSGALSAPTAARMTSVAAADVGLALPAGFTFLHGVDLWISGATLANGAALSAPATGAGSGAVLLVQVQEISGVSRFVLVGLGKISGGQITSQVITPVTGSAMPGIRSGGRFLYIQATGPIALAVGQVIDRNGVPEPGALVATPALPIVSFSMTGGGYVEAVPTGNSTVSAFDPVRGDRASSSGAFAADSEAYLILSMIPQPLRALSVTPANGATSVPLGSSVVATFTTAFNPALISNSSVMLVSSGGVVVPAVLTLSGANTIVTLHPTQSLAANSLYTFFISTSLATPTGDPLQPAVQSRFTTIDTAPAPPPPGGSIQATIPSSGTTTVSGTQGSIAPGDTVNILNITQGTSVPALVASDGSFSATVAANLGDVLQIQVITPAGAVTLIPLAHFQQTNSDGSVSASVDAGGGHIDGPGGVAVDVPAGAFSNAGILTLRPITPQDVPPGIIPAAQGTEFPLRGGLVIDTGGQTPKQYLNVSIAASTEDVPTSQWVVGQPMTIMQNGSPTTIFNMVDTAKLKNGRITTSSPPCPGIGGAGTFLFYKSVQVVTLVYAAMANGTSLGLLAQTVHPYLMNTVNYLMPTFNIVSNNTQPICMPVMTAPAALSPNQMQILVQAGPAKISPNDISLTVTNQTRDIQVSQMITAVQDYTVTIRGSDADVYQAQIIDNKGAQRLVTFVKNAPAVGGGDFVLHVAVGTIPDGYQSITLVDQTAGTDQSISAPVSSGGLTASVNGADADEYELDVKDASGNPTTWPIPNFKIIVTHPNGGGVVQTIAGQVPPAGELLNVGLITDDRNPPVAMNTTGAQYQDIDPHEPITITFSKPIDPNSLYNGFQVFDANGNRVAGNIVLSNNNRTVTFVPSSALRMGMTYRVLLTAGIRDAAGNALTPAQVSVSVIAPRLVSTTPAGSTFSNLMDVDFWNHPTLPVNYVVGVTDDLVGNKLLTFDVTNPASVKVIGSAQGPDYMRRVHVMTHPNLSPAIGGALALTNAYNTFHGYVAFYDLTFPENPREMGLKYLTVEPNNVGPETIAGTVKHLGEPRDVYGLQVAGDVETYSAVANQVGLMPVSVSKNSPEVNPALRTLEPYIAGDYYGVDFDARFGNLVAVNRQAPDLELLGPDVAVRASIRLPDLPRRVVVANNFNVLNSVQPPLDLAFVAGDQSLSIVDLTGGGLAMGSVIPMPGLLRDITLDYDRNIIYALGNIRAGGGQALFAIDVSSPALQGSVDDNGDGVDDRVLWIKDYPSVPNGLRFDNSRGLLYVGSGLGLDILRLASEKVIAPNTSLETVIDRVNHTETTHGGSLYFTLTEQGQVSIQIDGQALVDPAGIPITNKIYTAGQHCVAVQPNQVLSVGPHPFSVAANFDTSGISTSVVTSGVLEHDVTYQDAMPVGHTFVKGVDLADGHLALQRNDFSMAGVGPALEFTRTYSSQGGDQRGLMGANWNFNYASRLIQETTTGKVTLIGGEGGGIRFMRDGSGGYTPQVGYHGTLTPATTAQFDYYTKDHTRYTYLYEPLLTQTLEGACGAPSVENVFTLQSITDSRGNQLKLAYSSDPNHKDEVTQVTDAAGRSLYFTYAAIGQLNLDRLVAVSVPDPNAAGAKVELIEFEYDLVGNLIRATRGKTRSESYTYSNVLNGNGTNEHLLTNLVDPNQNETGYFYTINNVVETISGQSRTSSLDLVNQVLEASGTANAASTTFDFHNLSGYPGSQFTTVTDPRGVKTDWTMGVGGGLVTQKLVHTAQYNDVKTIMSYVPSATPGVYTTDLQQEIDPNCRKTDYTYDSKGNRTSERVELGGTCAPSGPFDPVSGSDGVSVPVYTKVYDQKFSKPTQTTDALGNVTLTPVDPNTGNVTSIKTDPLDGSGPVTTQFNYYVDVPGTSLHGLLKEKIDPRNFKTQYGYDTIGNLASVQDPLLNTITNKYDLRSRLTDSSDTFGHHTMTTYFDDVDLPHVVMRFVTNQPGDSSMASSTQVVTTTYKEGGEPLTIQDALGDVKSFTYDDLNRPIEESDGFFDADGAPATRAISYDYDGNGNKISQTSQVDSRDVTTTYAYDDLNRLTNTTVGSELVSTLGYDPAGNKTTETDLHNRSTTYRYDGLYRETQEILPIPDPNNKRITAYDLAGNVTSKSDANGHAVTTTYDGMNRLATQKNAVGVTITYKYDASSNKTQEANVTTGLTTAWPDYDGLNRPQTMTQSFTDPVAHAPVSYTTRYAYFDSQHAKETTDPRNFVTREVLNGLDEVIETTVDKNTLTQALLTTRRYDAIGKLRGVRDPKGQLTTTVYDGLGRLVKTTDPIGNSSKVYYDGSGNVVQTMDRRSPPIVRRKTHDDLSRETQDILVETIRNNGTPLVVTQTTYNDPANQRTVTNARKFSTVYQYDGIGRQVQLTDPYGFSVTSVWDGVNKISETDKRMNTTLYRYDAVNRPTLVIDPAPFSQQSASTTYNDAASQKTYVDRRGFAAVTQMDPLGRTLTVTRSGVTLETNTYDGNNNKVSAQDAAQKTTAFTYDGSNRLSEKIEGSGTADQASTTYSYDRAGNKEMERDARVAALGLSYTVFNTYDPDNRLSSVADDMGHITLYGYDGEGNKTDIVEPNGVLYYSSMTYEETGKLLSVTQAGGETTTYGYDENRNRTSQKDANRNVVQMGYDELDRMTSLTQDPNGFNFVTTIGYDQNGNENSRTEPKGNTITTTYDELNRKSTISYGFAPGDAFRPWRYTSGTVYTYDANNNVKQIDDTVVSGATSATLTTTRAWDTLDRLSSDTQPLPEGGSRAVSYTYFPNGTRETVKDPAGTITSYTYDGLNRTATATTITGVTRYSYYGDSRLKTVSYPNGVLETRLYDNAGRLSSLANQSGARPVSSYGYTYDANGNRLTQAEALGGVAENTGYTYDLLNRLKTVTYPVDADFPTGRKVTYTYDFVGNRTGELTQDSGGVQIGSLTGKFDAINRLSDLIDKVTPINTASFGYDQNGNQLTKTVNGLVTLYRYDLRDKMVEALSGGVIVGQYQYDCEDRRTERLGEGSTHQYVYDQTSTFLEYDGAGAPLAKYDYGSDRLISLTHITEGQRYYSFDGLRSVTALTDNTGSMAAAYHLDAWGNYRFPAEVGVSQNRFGFTGHLYDKETNLIFANARFYDPTVGRFTSQDSFLGDINNPPSLHRYMYGLADPTRYFDVSGHDAIDDIAHAEERAAGSVVGFGSGLFEGLKGAVEGTSKLGWTALKGLAGNEQAAEQFYNSVSDIGESLIDHPVDRLKARYLTAITEAGKLSREDRNFEAGKVYGKVFNNDLFTALTLGEGAVRGINAISKGAANVIAEASDSVGSVAQRLSSKTGSVRIGRAAEELSENTVPSNSQGGLTGLGLPAGKQPLLLEEPVAQGALKYRPTSGAILEPTSGRTTTILGSYKLDVESVVRELGDQKSLDFGAKPSGFNVLNVPKELIHSPKEFWTKFNKPWLDAAIARSDEFQAATAPEFPNLIRVNESGQYELSGFGREYLELRKQGFRYDPITKRFIR